jgi:tRNA pseudouridine55 synthase
VPHPRSRGRDVFGLLLLDKPSGCSSNQALQKVRRLYQANKAGHAGSLDPLATGMLPIFFGPATRLCAQLLDARKEYRVAGVLGRATTTGDAEGDVTVDRSAEPPPSLAEIDRALARFRGEISQVPPMYSALKRDGVPLYRLARRGLEVERPARRVVIEALTLEDYRWPEIRLVVRCSKGTYIRTLIEDIAAAVGTVAHVGALRRLAVMPFEGRAMSTLDELERLAAGQEGPAALDRLLLPADVALPGWPAVVLDAEMAAQFVRGQQVPAPAGAAPGSVRVYAEPQEFIGIGTLGAGGMLAPDRVFRR